MISQVRICIVKHALLLTFATYFRMLSSAAIQYSAHYQLVMAVVMSTTRYGAVLVRTALLCSIYVHYDLTNTQGK